MLSFKSKEEEAKKTSDKDSENNTQTCRCMDNLFQKVANFVLGENYGRKKTTVKGKVVLMKKNVLDFNDLGASVLDRAHELIGQHISIRFISATHADSTSTGLIFDFGSFFLFLFIYIYI
ncbi:putative linoleate 9S-lipoxygenase [Helianthus annuus]|nr:putative linoleate 9S-lipoxygenase [Helianthus annuus]